MIPDVDDMNDWIADPCRQPQTGRDEAEMGQIGIGHDRPVDGHGTRSSTIASFQLCFVIDEQQFLLGGPSE